MKDAHLVLDPAFRVGPIDRRIFGSFVEHMGRCVYTGIFEPGHPAADRDGFRTDVLELVRELGVTIIRYPGGNFVSGYQWEDGIGPRGSRPRRLDLAWRSIETNEVGIDEFVTWARRAGVEPMVAVNLGTRGIADACALLEYTNHPAGSSRADHRRANGHEAPHDIRLWCLGNEMDGEWQIGHKTAEEYGRLAAETGRAMRLIDPTIELVASGSSSSRMPTFGAWEATVLEATYDVVDYISLHAYYEEVDGDTASFLASGADMDRFIAAVASTADYVRAKLGRDKRLRLAFDEWNVWYMRRFDPARVPAWTVAPRLTEDDYNDRDAVVVGDLLITLLRHADRVAVACLAQLVNNSAPIRTEPGGRAWRQTTFHPFSLTARSAVGAVLLAEPDGPRHATGQHGDVPSVNATAVWNDESGELAVFAVNRRTDEALPLVVELRGFPPLELAGITVIGGLAHARTPEDREEPSPRPGSGQVTAAGLTAILEPGSWNLFRLVPPVADPKAD